MAGSYRNSRCGCFGGDSDALPPAHIPVGRHANKQAWSTPSGKCALTAPAGGESSPGVVRGRGRPGGADPGDQGGGGAAAHAPRAVRGHWDKAAKGMDGTGGAAGRAGRRGARLAGEEDFSLERPWLCRMPSTFVARVASSRPLHLTSTDRLLLSPSPLDLPSPKGVILYGDPGTGKTLLAKAVANSTSATFLRVVGSELIQKYLGDGPKLVRELFRVADELAPSIVFIGERGRGISITAGLVPRAPREQVVVDFRLCTVFRVRRVSQAWKRELGFLRLTAYRTATQPGTVGGLARLMSLGDLGFGGNVVCSRVEASESLFCLCPVPPFPSLSWLLT